VSAIGEPLRRLPPPSQILGSAAIVLVCVMAGMAAADETRVRFAVAAALLLLLAGVGHRTPRPLVFGLVMWLAALGLVRRVFSEFSPGGGADPLLLVGPVAILTLTLTAYERGAFSHPTRLSRLVTAMTGLVVLGAFNPLQGSLLAGVSGLIFFVPLLAFWIGRAYCDDSTMTKALVLFGLLSLPAAGYGLYQTFSGFPSWDRRWLETVSFASLDVEGTTRPFSTFSSSAEFGTFLAVAVVIWLGLTARKLLLPIAIGVGCLLGTAIVYQSSRGTVVMIVTAVGIMIGAKKRLPLGFALAFAVGLLLALPFAVGAVAPSSFGGDEQSALVQHQVEGLANPLDPETSTAGEHLDLMVNGIKSAFTAPLGHGIAAVTRAGAKFGGLSAGTEADPSNAAVSLGMLGLIVYLLLFAAAYSRVYRLARSGDPVAVACLGVVTVMLFQWLNGGQYSVAFLPWLIFGWCDRRLTAEAEADAERAP
jgi:hypothetical protein